MLHTKHLLCGAVLGASLAAVSVVSAQSFYTAKTGPGGTWNLYEVVHVAATWRAAHNSAIAKEAQSTGLPSVAGNTLKGHHAAVSGWAENGYLSLMAINATNSSNVWIGLTDSVDLGDPAWTDAGTSQTSDQWYWAGTTGGTGPGGALRLSEGGAHQAFFTGEPNNSTGALAAGEDAVELRTDGRWNDNAHDLAATTRRYIIEWDIGSATPVGGAKVISPLYTAPYGAGGKWNLYMLSGESDTWLNAHNRAIGMEAQATGAAGVAGSTVKGHLLQISSRNENTYGVAMANRLLTFNNQLGANTATTNVWLGLTDSADLGVTTDAVANEMSDWIWAGTSGGTGPAGELKIDEVLEDGAVVNFWFNANTGGTGEPNNSVTATFVDGEDAGELRGDGRWNDLPHKLYGTASGGNISRHYIIEWDIGATAPIDGADILPVYYTAQHGAGGTWNLYQLDHTMGTWADFGDRVISPTGLPASATGIPTLSANTTKGHLIEISDAHELGWAHRLSNYTGGWIGLTDNETYGGQEAGNASSNPTNQQAPFWIWSSADPLTPASANTFRRWNAGEPNDSGNNEDACEITNVGIMNDHRMYDLTVIRKGLMEWDIQSATPIAGAMILEAQPLFAGTRTLTNPPAAGTWSVKELKNVTQNNITPAMATVNTLTNALVNEGTVPVLNLNDINVPADGLNYPGWGDQGLFGRDLPYVGDVLTVDDNNIARIAQTKLVVTEDADYTFNMHADDGMALRITGATFSAAYGSGQIQGDTLFFANTGGDANSRGLVHLAPGTYDLEVISWEGTSGSSVELSWAKGDFVSDEAGAGKWSLVGSPSAAYPAPILPATLGAEPVITGPEWSIRTVSGAGALTTLTGVVSALTGTTGTSTYSTAPVLNHSDPESSGTGGIFAGELALSTNTGADDNNFAIHARARLQIDTAGQHTIAVRSSEPVAIRIKGQVWENVGGEFGVDPLDPSTVFTERNNPANNALTGEMISRAVITLPVGCHDLEVITSDRTEAFFVEVYSRPGNVVNTAEYASNATANNGLAAPAAATYRLVGYRSTGNLSVLGVTSTGWTRGGTTPAATAPAGWPALNIAGHETWITGNGFTTDPTSRDTVNDRDPQNPTTDGGIPNGRDFWRNTTADDHNNTELYTARLVVPAAGTYSIGWQGDDGGFLEILGLPAGVEFTAIEARPVLGGVIANSSGTVPSVNGRIQLGVGGGNTRTIGRITFPATLTYPAEFDLRSLHFEGTGGAYWEIFAGPANGYGRMVTLLQRDAAGDIADFSGLLLAGPDLKLIDAALTPTQNFSFSFESVIGLTYSIQRTAGSPTGINGWQTIDTVTATDITTTWTTPAPINPATDPRYFYRAIKP